MKTKEIVENLAEFEKDYAIDAAGTVENIESFLEKNDFSEQGGEMRDVSRWTRDGEITNDEIFLSYDMGGKRIGISYHEFCKKCGDAIDALGDSIDVCECK